MLLASLRALSCFSGVMLFFLSVFCGLVFRGEGCGELFDFFACGDFGFAFEEIFAADVHGELRGRWDFEGFEGLSHFLFGDACFDGAGMSAARFAAMVGINYSTICSWVQERNKKQGKDSLLTEAAAKTHVQWIEAEMA
jgi:hypothetical protein